MSIISLKEFIELKNEFTKKHDKDKYIKLLEENIESLIDELERLKKQAKSNSNLDEHHLQVLEIFVKRDSSIKESELKRLFASNIDLQIALQELIDNDYLEYPHVFCSYDEDEDDWARLSLNSSKKAEVLKAIRETVK